MGSRTRTKELKPHSINNEIDNDNKSTKNTWKESQHTKDNTVVRVRTKSDQNSSNYTLRACHKLKTSPNL